MSHKVFSIPIDRKRKIKIIVSPNPSLFFKDKIEKISVINKINKYSSSEKFLNALKGEKRIETRRGIRKIVEKDLYQKSSKLINKKKNKNIAE